MRRARVKKEDLGDRLAVAGLEDAADRLEVETVGLHFAGQLDAGDMLVVVIAGAAADDRRRQQAAGLVRADVAHRHPGALGELPDRHLPIGGLGRHFQEKRYETGR
jgi:hypothetical protein